MGISFSCKKSSLNILTRHFFVTFTIRMHMYVQTELLTSSSAQSHDGQKKERANQQLHGGDDADQRQ